MPWKVNFEETVCDELKVALLGLTPEKRSSKICKQSCWVVGFAAKCLMDILRLPCGAGHVFTPENSGTE